jgi:hypothetical protein
MMKKMYSTLAMCLAAITSFAQTTNPTIPANGLVFHLPLNGDVHGMDASPNDYHFVVQNQTYQVGLTGDDFEAFVHNGTNTSIVRTFDLSDLQSMNQTFTIGMWVRVDQFPNLYSNLFEMDQNHFLRIAAPAGNIVHFEYGYLDVNGNYRLFGGAAGPSQMPMDRNLFRTKWMHLTLVSNMLSDNTRDVSLFINGELLGGNNFSAPSVPHFTGNAPFAIGSRSGATNMTMSGLVQDFVWYNRVLTGAEIQALACYVNADITEEEGVLSVNDGMYTYQWQDCANGNANIPNADGNSYAVFSGEGSYAVVVTRNGGCALTSDCFDFDNNGGGGDPASVNEFELNAVKLYPNPAQDQVTIEGIEKGSTIELINALGAVVQQKQASGYSETVSVQNLPEGMYMVRITMTNGQTIHQRLLVRN